MNKELLRQAQAALVIQDVVLHSSQITAKDDYSPFKPLSDGEGLNTHYRFGTVERLHYSLGEADSAQELLEYRYQTGLRLYPSDDEFGGENTPALVEVNTIFSAVYLLTNSDMPQEALDEFGKHNVGLHVWPYWREYAAATFSRMRLPPVVIPFYQVSHDEKDTGGE